MEKRIELLAPGGSFDSARVAILAGADAVYCGLQRFNARQRAKNLTPEEFKELLLIAHRHNCKVYLTLNTLLFENEINEIFELLSDIRLWGVDAVIVQDWGLIGLLKEYFPSVKVHGSTQMTTHNTGQLKLLKKSGVSSVNLCRELSLPEIREVCAECEVYGIKAEVFVHGAYCIAFSGQCYMSGVMSGRSGNRGECMQPCRKTYLYDGGNKRSPILNLKDLSAFSRLPDLIEAGVDALKIEGRMRNFTYVYVVVSAWRRQIDRYFDTGVAAKDDPELHKVFNRSFTCGYLDGDIGAHMFADSSEDRSLLTLGRVKSYTADTRTLQLESKTDIKPGTEIRIYSKEFTFVCTGIIEYETGENSYRFRITDKLKRHISKGDIICRRALPEVYADIKKRIENLHTPKTKLTVTIHGKAGERLTAGFKTDKLSVLVHSDTLLTPAGKHPLTKDIILKKIKNAAGKWFETEKIDFSEFNDNLFLPLSDLTRMLRKAFDELNTGVNNIEEVRIRPFLGPENPPPSQTPPSVALLSDKIDELNQCGGPANKLLLELPVDMGNHIDYYCRLLNRHEGIIPWFPAILIGKRFSGAVQLLKKLNPPLLVTDNSGIGAVASEMGIGWIAGPLLNCTNSLALRTLHKYGGCSGAFISHELNRNRMKSIFAPSEDFSRWYTLFAPLLLMNTRQCIIRNCGYCRKKRFDDECLESCSRRKEILDDNKRSLFLVKRRGFYNQLYNGTHYFNPDIINDINPGNAVFLVDLRAIPSKTSLYVSKKEFVEKIEAAVIGDNAVRKTLPKLAGSTTAGQYFRGLKDAKRKKPTIIHE